MTGQSPILLQMGSHVEAGEVLVAVGDDGGEVPLSTLSSDDYR